MILWVDLVLNLTAVRHGYQYAVCARQRSLNLNF